MTDKLKLIDAEIMACRSKMGALVGGGGVVLRAGDEKKKLENIISDAQTYAIKIANERNVKVEWLNQISDEEKKKQFKYITDTPMFVDWCFKFDTKFLVKIQFNKIIIHNIDMKAPPDVLFIKFSTDMTYTKEFEEQFKIDAKDAKAQAPRINSIVFMRGGSVAILVILNCDDRKKYSILTLQPRVPVGTSLLEIPAGMLDGSSDFAGVAATELRQEAGIDIKQNELENLMNPGQFDDPTAAYPSPGGCDETMRFYLYEPIKIFSIQEINAMKGRMTGEFKEGEVIHLNVVTLEKLRENITDMKTTTALYLYDKYMKDLTENSKTVRNTRKRQQRLVNLAISMKNIETELQEIQERKNELISEEGRLNPKINQILQSYVSSILPNLIALMHNNGQVMLRTEMKSVVLDAVTTFTDDTAFDPKHEYEIDYVFGVICANLYNEFNAGSLSFKDLLKNNITAVANEKSQKSKQQFDIFAN
jgi:ADP-sugar diphosphatase